jgi:hypothetical protein
VLKETIYLKLKGSKHHHPLKVKGLFEKDKRAPDTNAGASAS